MMEDWKDGTKNDFRAVVLSGLPKSHYSSIPTFHYSLFSNEEI
jgi:hypothetical protein